MSMCNICLRTELKFSKLDKKLSSFYAELSGNTVNKKAVFCTTCKQYLIKCLEFKQLCQESSKILKNWRKKIKPSIQLNNLHALITPLFKKIIATEIIINETENSNNTTDIKEETDNNSITIENNDNSSKINDNSPKINDNCPKIIDNCPKIIDNCPKINDNSPKINDNSTKINENYVANNEPTENNDSLVVKDDFLIEPKEESDFNYEYSNGNINDSEMNTNESDLMNDNHLNDDDSEDDKFISQLLKDVKKKSNKRKKKTKKHDFDNKHETPITRKRKKQPLKNKQEYESIFDIEYFKNDEEAKAEFASRQHSDYYKNATFKCRVCFTAFKCQKVLDYHMKWHNPSSGEFLCDICQMRFKTYLSMRKHKNNVHYGRYKCKVCPLITYHKMVMILHFRKHQGVEYKCKYCQKLYNHSSTYLTHMRTAHRSIHTCTECARTFVSPTGLRVHKQKVHQCISQVDREGVHCAECDITFATEDVYIVHVLHTPVHKHLASTIIACPECGKRFEDKLTLRTHRRQSHPNYNYSWSKNADKTGARKEFKCRECDATGVHNSWLYNHYRREHPDLTYEAAVYDDTRRHLCEHCGKSFVHLWQLSEHTLLHSGLRPHGCATCGATFRTNTALRMHSERHLPPNRPCTVCAKKFASASNLANHMRSHIGERRYKCSVCSKGFLHSAALREHVRGVHLHVRRDRRPKGHALVLQSEIT